LVLFSFLFSLFPVPSLCSFHFFPPSFHCWATFVLLGAGSSFLARGSVWVSPSLVALSWPFFLGSFRRFVLFLACLPCLLCCSGRRRSGHAARSERNGLKETKTRKPPASGFSVSLVAPARSRAVPCLLLCVLCAGHKSRHSGEPWNGCGKTNLNGQTCCRV